MELLWECFHMEREWECWLHNRMFARQQVDETPFLERAPCAPGVDRERYSSTLFFLPSPTQLELTPRGRPPRNNPRFTG